MEASNGQHSRRRVGGVSGIHIRWPDAHWFGRPRDRDARHRPDTRGQPLRVTPRRLFTVWFAPQVTITGVFTGSLAIVFGLGFWLGLLAMVIGTVLGSLPVAYLSTWGPRTGTGQLPAVPDGVRPHGCPARDRPMGLVDRLGRAGRTVRR